MKAKGKREAMWHWLPANEPVFENRKTKKTPIPMDFRASIANLQLRSSEWQPKFMGKDAHATVFALGSER